jgi:hypothetical protein
MALQGIIQAATDGAQGFDADSVISLATAQQFVDDGYTFCLRYLSLGGGQAKGDLSADEASDILAAGLALMPVQHVHRVGWEPTAELGQTIGRNAARNAAAVGFPAGVNVWCDLESVAEGSSAEDIVGYCNAWFTAVAAAGYVGPDAGLTGDQLYDLAVEHYWKSASDVPALPVRGYQMTQTLVPDAVHGLGIDGDTTQTDSKGGQALWLVVETP